MKQPTASSFEKRSISVEKRNALSRSTVDGKARLKETHALKRKREANDASQPTQLKAMPGLLPNTTDRLGHYSESSSRLKKRESSDKDITCAKYSTTKLELSKDSCMTEGNDRQDEIVMDSDKENVKFGEYHKEGDTTKAKHTLDSTLSDIHCNSGSTSSYPFSRDLPKFQRDNHSMNLTFENAKKRELIERNMGQFANFNGKNANSMSKKRKEPMFVENPKALDDDSIVGVQVDSMSCKQMKKLKQSRVTRKDEAEDGGGDLNHVGLEDDTTTILKNDHAKVSVSSCVEQQCYSCSKPIDKPTWSGIFKTDDKEYVSLDGHLSTKSCEKAWSLSKQFLKVVEVKKLSRLEVWPKAWEVPKPTADDIGIYFFSHEMRQDEGLDLLVREVMQNDLALRAIIGEAEMLIFPSILLSNPHQTFQGKHYLWGVFKRRENNGVLVEEPLSVVGSCEMEKQQNVVSDQPNHMLPGEEPNQEMIQMVSVIPLERHMLPPNKSTQEVEASRLKGPTNKGFDPKAPSEEGGQAEGTPIATDAAAFPASHGQINPIMGHTPGRLMGFVVRKTPKLDRIIRDIEQEGALVFAMQGEMVGAGSWATSKGTATQK
ncbi:protein PARALOG OF AIPP2-like [Miscanthus floridulus]|uniref:protein PARALOG OF AIPP2-like n=1 Tax=Miscanthus floridulus TaxID=154761 RepID=UPI0034594A34